MLAYDPDLSGPSSPQRCPQPTVMHVLSGDGLAQWARRVILTSTRVLVLALREPSGPRRAPPPGWWISLKRGKNGHLHHPGLRFSEGNRYSTTIILFGSESGIH